MGNKLYVGNLPYSFRDEDLQQAFAAHGTVSSAKVMMERDTGRSKGFGFVEMGSDAEAQAAISGMNGQQYGGRGLVVNEARPMEARPPRSGGFGGGGGAGGGGGGATGASGGRSITNSGSTDIGGGGGRSTSIGGGGSTSSSTTSCSSIMTTSDSGGFTKMNVPKPFRTAIPQPATTAPTVAIPTRRVCVLFRFVW